MVVPVIAAGVAPPITGGLDKSSVPPSVIVPLVVIGPPVNVIPLTVPLVAMLVIVPVVGVDQEGRPEAKVSTCPFEPAANNEVDPADA